MMRQEFQKISTQLICRTLACFLAALVFGIAEVGDQMTNPDATIESAHIAPPELDGTQAATPSDLQRTATLSPEYVSVNGRNSREGQWIDLDELEPSARREEFSQLLETNPAMGEAPSIQVRRPDDSYETSGY